MQERTKSSKKLGRDEVLSARDLLDRCTHLKRFLEDEWGRIGLELQQVRQPDDVRAALMLVPGVELCLPFRNHAGCLLREGTETVGWRELRLTRQQHEKAVAAESLLWSEYHSARQNTEEATTALKVAIGQFGAANVAPVAEKLGVEDLTNNSNQLEASLKEAQNQRQMLRNRLSSQEAWYARNEIVKFVRSRRYDKNPLNFAKAMAGLPEYGWLYSFRKCSAIKRESLPPATLNFRIREILTLIMRRTKPLSLKKIEMKLRDELLRRGTDPPIRAHIGPNWWYMEQAFSECRGKGFKRVELPYRIMARFLEHVQRPKSLLEVELAKRQQLVSD